MRQSQQERRIAVQLLQARHEKEVIRKNRITRELQYEKARLKDFEDALNREAVRLCFLLLRCYFLTNINSLFLKQTKNEVITLLVSKDMNYI